MTKNLVLIFYFSLLHNDVMVVLMLQLLDFFVLLDLLVCLIFNTPLSRVPLCSWVYRLCIWRWVWNTIPLIGNSYGIHSKRESSVWGITAVFIQNKSIFCVGNNVSVHSQDSCAWGITTVFIPWQLNLKLLVFFHYFFKTAIYLNKSLSLVNSTGTFYFKFIFFHHSTRTVV